MASIVSAETLNSRCRVLIHVLPKGFHRFRHYGLLAGGTRDESIARARATIEHVRAVSATCSH
jgi:hypothetical protein